MLLLDEATSHLDVQTERTVAENLRSLACTQIIIAHRLSTIRDADTILVLDQGTIVERGDHHNLVRRAGHYARLIGQQLDRGEATSKQGPDRIHPSTLASHHPPPKGLPRMPSRAGPRPTAIRRVLRSWHDHEVEV